MTSTRTQGAGEGERDVIDRQMTQLVGPPGAQDAGVRRAEQDVREVLESVRAHVVRGPERRVRDEVPYDADRHMDREPSRSGTDRRQPTRKAGDPDQRSGTDRRVAWRRKPTLGGTGRAYVRPLRTERRAVIGRRVGPNDRRHQGEKPSVALDAGDGSGKDRIAAGGTRGVGERGWTPQEFADACTIAGLTFAEVQRLTGALDLVTRNRSAPVEPVGWQIVVLDDDGSDLWTQRFVERTKKQPEAPFYGDGFRVVPLVPLAPPADREGAQ